MGHQAWAAFLYVLSPGVFLVGLFAIVAAPESFWEIVGVEAVAWVVMLALVVYRFGPDVLFESRAEILATLEDEEDSEPVSTGRGEYTSSQLAAAFDRADGNRPDSPEMRRP